MLAVQAKNTLLGLPPARMPALVYRTEPDMFELPAISKRAIALPAMAKPIISMKDALAIFASSDEEEPSSVDAAIMD